MRPRLGRTGAGGDLKITNDSHVLHAAGVAVSDEHGACGGKRSKHPTVEYQPVRVGEAVATDDNGGFQSI